MIVCYNGVNKSEGNKLAPCFESLNTFNGCCQPNGGRRSKI